MENHDISIRLENNGLNKRFIGGVYQKLSSDGFSQHDFDINFREEKRLNQVIYLEIFYSYEKEYFFNTEIEVSSTKGTAVFTMHWSPGIVTKVEFGSFTDPEVFFTQLEAWVGRLRDEIKSSTTGRQVNEIQKKVEELDKLIKEKFDQNDTSNFSEDEEYEMKTRLDAFEKLVSEKLQSLEKDNQILKEKQAELHKEVELLKDQLGVLPKNKWVRAMGIKLINFGAKNPKAAMQIGGAVLNEVLPPELKNVLPLPDSLSDVNKS